jgi:2-polyprenyl-6-hydroxyphenyl methylase/3-demethylubiquinone-9 3-methyltransferase
LDLGCGSGNTGVELDSSAYQDYTGVDISDVAIRRAKAKTEEHGRKGKNQYVQDEILSYVPSQQFDVILLRDSIYYLPTSKVKAMLSRYGRYLKENGVFIVRLWRRGRYRMIEELIRKDFRVIDRTVSDRVDGVVMVFQTENSSYTL